MPLALDRTWLAADLAGGVLEADFGHTALYDELRDLDYCVHKTPVAHARFNVLATVDESSYVPNTMIKMGGDHPVVWSNPHYKARNVYIFMGHHGGLFDNPNFVQLFRNAIFWGAGQ